MRGVAWRGVFGNDRPVEVEIGPGRGDVLLAFAAAVPGRNFFGIERPGGAAAAIAARAAARGLANVKVVAGDARCIVAELVPDGSVAAYHVYFPDPWPKTRHRKRRLASADFATALARTLAPGGTVDVASDLSAIVERFAAELERANLVRVRGAQPRAARPITAFERKYASGGTYEARFSRPASKAEEGAPAPDARTVDGT
jgi:tRNA (guanine-N7-)-methyltransferase